MILLKKTPSPAKPAAKPAVPNVWQDKEKLASIKVPPPSSLLLVKKGDDLSQNQANRNDIENIVVNNNIVCDVCVKSSSAERMAGQRKAR